jgi:lysophospholipase L1-like esterase
MFKKISVFFGLNILICIFAFFFAAKYITKTYSFEKDGNWFSKKQNIYTYVSGASEFAKNPDTLKNGQLDLTSWFGNHQIILKKTYDVDEVEIKVNVAKSGLFGILFNANLFHSLEQSGIKLSANQYIASSFFKSNQKGKFLYKKELKNVKIPPKKWHIVKLKFSKDKTCSYIDENLIDCSDEILLSKPSKIGLFGGLGGFLYNETNVHIDYIKLYKNNELIFQDDFSAISSKPLLFFGIFICISILLFLISKIIFIKKRNEFLYQTMLQITVLIIIALGFFTNKYIEKFSLYNLLNSGKFSWIQKDKEVKNVDDLRTNFKELKYYSAYTDILLPQLSGKDIRKIRGYYFAKKVYAPTNIKKQSDKKVFKILIMGSSQTYGSGAFSPNDLSSLQYEKMLKKDYKNVDIQVYNAGIPGIYLETLFNIYKDEKLYEKYDFIIVNMSNNDVFTEAKEFESFVFDFSKFSKEKNANLAFSLEPINAEYSGTIRKYEPYKHMLMRKVAQKMQIPVIETHEKIYNKRNDGFLWWDMIHFTPYGQYIFANELYNESKDIIDKLIEKR